MTDRDEWVERAKAKLDEWNAELDELETKAEAAKAEQKERYERLISDLRGYRDRARKRLEEIEESGDSAWAELKEGAERAWNALSKGFRAAMEEFKKDREEPPAPPKPPAPPA